jgi:putative tricarboxylic transport membrane protein
LAFMSAFVGGIASALLLGLVARPMASFAGKFGAAENVMAILLAAVCIGKAYRRQFPAAMMMMGLGFFLATVGIDPNSNEQRYTFGIPGMLSGIPLVPVAVGLFGIAQALVMVSSPVPQFDSSLIQSAGLSWRGFLEPFRYPKAMFKGLFLGSAIVAAECANNSNSGGAMITVLTLGIPGDAITAIIMGVFVVHGIVPGPSLFTDRPEIINGVLASLLIINFVILGLLILTVKPLARLAYVNPRILGLVILVLGFVGSYSAANSMYYVIIAAAFGVFGLVCAQGKIPTIPLILGMVMADTLEASLRQLLGRSDGSLEPFVTRPMSLAMLIAIVVILFWPFFMALGKRFQRSNTSNPS